MLYEAIRHSKKAPNYYREYKCSVKFGILVEYVINNNFSQKEYVSSLIGVRANTTLDL